MNRREDPYLETLHELLDDVSAPDGDYFTVIDRIRALAAQRDAAISKLEQCELGCPNA
jgi:hypothetical protein